LSDLHRRCAPLCHYLRFSVDPTNIGFAAADRCLS
jgi:hypothetical protein